MTKNTTTNLTERERKSLEQKQQKILNYYKESKWKELIGAISDGIIQKNDQWELEMTSGQWTEEEKFAKKRKLVEVLQKQREIEKANEINLSDLWIKAVSLKESFDNTIKILKEIINKEDKFREYSAIKNFIIEHKDYESNKYKYYEYDKWIFWYIENSIYNFRKNNILDIPSEKENFYISIIDLIENIRTNSRVAVFEEIYNSHFYDLIKKNWLDDYLNDPKYKMLKNLHKKTKKDIENSYAPSKITFKNNMNDIIIKINNDTAWVLENQIISDYIRTINNIPTNHPEYNKEDFEINQKVADYLIKSNEFSNYLLGDLKEPILYQEKNIEHIFRNVVQHLPQKKDHTDMIDRYDVYAKGIDNDNIVLQAIMSDVLDKIVKVLDKNLSQYSRRHRGNGKLIRELIKSGIIHDYVYKIGKLDMTNLREEYKKIRTNLKIKYTDDNHPKKDVILAEIDKALLQIK